MTGAANAANGTPEVVFGFLLAAIVSGDLGPGARLPTERELAASWSTSRASAAKAVARLEEWRMVSARHGSGVTVRPRRDWSFSAMPAVLEHADGSARLALARELSALLLDLTGEAFRRCRRRLAPGDLDPARAAVTAAWDVRDDTRRWLVADGEQFARTLEVCGLWPTLFLVNDTAEAYRAIVTSVPVRDLVPRDYVAAHEAQFAALEANRFDDAADLLRAYLRRQDRVLGRANRKVSP